MATIGTPIEHNPTKCILLGKVRDQTMVFSKSNGWCFYYPGINEYLWKFFDTEFEIRKMKQEINKKLPIGMNSLEIRPYIL